MNHCKSILVTIAVIFLTNTFILITNASLSKNVSLTNITELQSVNEKTAREMWKDTEKMVKQTMKNLVKFALPMMMKASETLQISSKCTKSLLKVVGGAKQLKTWALKMLDSSGKLPNGFLSGNLASFGEYDGCLELKVENQFQGQYCLVDIHFPMPERVPFIPADQRIPEFANFSKPDTLFEYMLTSAQSFHFLSLRTSVCVPSTCSTEEIQAITQKAINETGIEWKATVANCDVIQPVILTTSEIVILCVIGVIVFVVLLGTVIDVILTLTSEDDSYRTNAGTLVRTFICFSAYANTQRLLKKDNSPDTIKLFHGMKVITVMWVILNHNYFYINLRGMGNLLNARAFGKQIAFHLIINGFLNVETFFFISAVLVTYGWMKSKEKKLNIFLYIFRRIWRLTPPFMFVIATAFLVPHLGSGPIWKETVDVMVNKCRKNWWTNLLYINNFIPSSEMCFQWAWYIAVDTHLYIIAIAVLIPIKSRPRVGFAVIAALFAIGIISTIGTNLYYKLFGTGLYIFPHPDDMNYFADYGYFKTHLHLATYCIGMCAGYILAIRPKIRVPLILNVVGWLIAFTTALAVLYGVYDWNQGNLPDLAVSTLYAATNKLVWSLALAWVTVMCYTGNGGIANSILSWPGFVILSRLTYMAYLVHPVIQHMYMGSTRIAFPVEHRTLSFMFLSHVVLAFLVAYPASLLFESPFMALEKLLFSGRVQQPRKKEPKRVEENRERSLHHSQRKAENGICTINIRKITNEP